VATLALFDTGSEVTLIQQGIPANLGIAPHDARDIVTIDNRIVRCNVFAVTLAFPNTSLVIEDLWVAEAGFETYSRADVQVIIGRSVLRKGTFTYNGWDRLFTFEVTSP
jgi:predicted aspartyl protease